MLSEEMKKEVVEHARHGAKYSLGVENDTYYLERLAYGAGIAENEMEEARRLHEQAYTEEVERLGRVGEEMRKHLERSLIPYFEQRGKEDFVEGRGCVTVSAYLEAARINLTIGVGWMSSKEYVSAYFKGWKRAEADSIKQEGVCEK